MRVDWIVVGAGLTGCVVAERIASVLEQSVLVIERRDHIGGNAFDHYDGNGVLVHRYGPHIFHTRARHVWDHLSRFTDWRPYYHRVLAVVEGRPVPVPFNLNSIAALLPGRLAERVEDALIRDFGFGRKVPILELRRSASGELRQLADYVYENVFRGYTRKQWGVEPEELDASVTSRVPVHVSRDDRYFQDPYQGIPRHGYAEMCRRMLDHPNIRLMLNASHEGLRGQIRHRGLIFTGPIDAFFDHRYGELPYRSLRFDFQHFDQARHQEVAQVNYPNEYAFTRVTEFKQLSGQSCDGTTVALEYPEAYQRGVNDPCYPIPRPENERLYARYRADAERLSGHTIFAGRLAEYRYYNMDQAVARALQVFEKQVRPRMDSGVRREVSAGRLRAPRAPAPPASAG